MNSRIVTPKNFQSRSAQGNGGGDQPEPAWKIRNKRLDNIPLEDVFDALGAYAKDGSGGGWKKYDVAGMTVISKGQFWENTQGAQEKGMGGTRLVMMAFDWPHDKEGYEKARKWLEANCDPERQADSSWQDSDDSESKSGFRAPPNLSDNRRHMSAVRNYLSGTGKGERWIPPSLVGRLLNDGSLYPSQEWNPELKRMDGPTTCVFLGYESAEIRSTDPQGVKKAATGSDPKISGFIAQAQATRTDRRVVLTEAAIDAVSYAALDPSAYVISCNGVNRLELQIRAARQCIASGVPLVVALDSDDAGDRAAQSIFNTLLVGEMLKGWLANSMVAEEMKANPGKPEDEVREGVLATIDGWMDGTDGELANIVAEPSLSPHRNFFNTGWSERMGVTNLVRKMGDDGKPTSELVDTGETSGPVVTIRVKEGTHPRLPPRLTLHVHPKELEFISRRLGIFRARADDAIPGCKDWNDVLKHLGMPYRTEYERAASENFERTLPKVPPEVLSAMRMPGCRRSPETGKEPSAENSNTAEQEPDPDRTTRRGRHP